MGPAIKASSSWGFASPFDCKARWHRRIINAVHERLKAVWKASVRRWCDQLTSAVPAFKLLDLVMRVASRSGFLFSETEALFLSFGG